VSWRVLAARLRGLLRREAVLSDIDDELRSHLELATEANIARGMSPDEARAAAVASFGNRGRAQDLAHDVRGGGWADSVWQDLRQGARMLRRNPAFAAIALLTLALGIGATTAIFSVVNAVLLRPLPYPQADRLVTVRTQQRSSGEGFNSSMPDYRAWRDETTAFVGLAAYRYRDVNLVGGGAPPERVEGARVTTNLFSVLGVGPALGRGFLASEEAFGHHRVVLLSHALWQTRFGGSATILGSAISIGSEPHVVVGVMPAGMPFFSNRPEVALWTPLAFAPGDNMNTRNNHYVRVVGRLRPDVTEAQAQAQLDVVAARVGRQFRENEGLGARVAWLGASVVGDVRQTLLVLAGAVAFLLLVSCVNVANLLLARAAGRERELAVRASLGAGRGRIIRQLLLESVPLGLLGGALGLALAVTATAALATLLPSTLPRHNAIRVDGAVLGFALAVTLLTTLFFGIMPAFQASRVSVLEALKSGDRSATAGRGRVRLRGLLVAGEIGLSLMLLIGAGLMIKTFVKLRHVDVGFSGHEVVTMKVPLPDTKYPSANTFPPPRDAPPPAGLHFYAQLLARVSALPGVEAAAVSTTLPLGAGMGSWGKMMSVEGHPRPTSLDRVPLVEFTLMSPDYLRVMGIAVRRGRAFTAGDTDGSAPVALVNETAARELFRGEDPLGKTIWLGPPEDMHPFLASLGPAGRLPRRRVVGVIADVRSTLSEPPAAEIYAPYTQNRHEGWSNSFMLSVRGPSATQLLAPIRAAVATLDREQPITDVATMDERVHQALARSRFSTLLLGLFAGVALLLAAVGVYGVMSQSVAQRTREFGLRMALGARAGNVLWMVFRQALVLTLAGVAAGLLGAAALTRVMARMLYGVSATDPQTFAAVAVVLLAVALAACLPPARRATRVHPMESLRYE
jgi:putative ABC transport system permease protein